MLCCGLARDDTALYISCVTGCRFTTSDSTVSQLDICFDGTTSAEWQFCFDASTESPALPQSSGADQRRLDSRELECAEDTEDCRFMGLDDGTMLGAVTSTSSELLVTLAAANSSMVTEWLGLLFFYQQSSTHPAAYFSSPAFWNEDLNEQVDTTTTVTQLTTLAYIMSIICCSR